MDCDYDEKLDFDDDEIEIMEESLGSTQEMPTPVPGNSSTAKKRNRRTENFTSEDKKLLAKEVKKNTVIWDLADEHHFNINAVNLAWRKISGVMKRSVEECKSAWTALRESQRYRKTKQKKSGSAGGVPIDEGSGEIDWEFSEDLAFLPVTSKKRKTFSTSGSTEFDASRAGPSNYSYQRKPEASSTQNEDVQLALAVESLIEQQKTLNASVIMAPAAAISPPIVHKALEYEAVWGTMERMLVKLSPDDIDDAIFEMTALLYEKLKSNRKINDSAK